MSMRLLPIVLLLCAGAFCQDVPPQTGRPVPADSGVTPPKIAHTVSAAIADEARMARLHGNIVLAVVVGVDGFAEDVRVVRSMGMGLDEGVIEAVKSKGRSRLDEKHGTVTVSLDIPPEGVPENLRAEKSSNPALENEAISIARGWRFGPAKQDGNPIPVHCTLDFVVSNPDPRTPR
jgi:TonB family protein